MICRAAKRAIPPVLLALAACVPTPAAQTAPPLAPGLARVWIVRELEPGTDFYAPYVTVDGVSMGISPQSSAFYRDLPPGRHVFDVENCLRHPEAARVLELRPGEVASLQVTSLQNYAGWDCHPIDAYYLSPLPDRMRPYYLARVTYLGAR
ncbi:MAG TPA: hypothetical protein VFA12_08290 [Stellaceae bacterium]|jgi:hypothetical protein|nr:hypothetical protein [Stellaceae bacterium]